MILWLGPVGLRSLFPFLLLLLVGGPWLLLRIGSILMRFSSRMGRMFLILLFLLTVLIGSFCWMGKRFGSGG